MFPAGTILMYDNESPIPDGWEVLAENVLYKYRLFNDYSHTLPQNVEGYVTYIIKTKDEDNGL